MDMNMDTKDIIKDIKVKELISGIVENIVPACVYPEFYTRKQMEQAMEELAKKVMEMQTGKIKEMEKRVSDAGWQYEYDHRDDWRKITEMGM